MLRSARALTALLLLAAPACASLGALQQVLQPPRFSADAQRPAELRLLPPSVQHPTGGLAVRLWARVDNPNAFAVTLASLAGNLLLEGRPAARVDFPLGLPLPAARDTVVPLDISLGLSDLPGLGDVATRALAGSPIAYRLEGSFSVDAGVLGQPSFGPMALLTGSVQPRR